MRKEANRFQRKRVHMFCVIEILTSILVNNGTVGKQTANLLSIRLKLPDIALILDGNSEHVAQA